MVQIVWDEKLNKWVNLDPDDEVSFTLKNCDIHVVCGLLQEDSGPAAPPSDTELNGGGSALASNSGNQPMGINTTTNASNTTNNQTADQNIYSRRLNTKRSSKGVF